MKLKDEFNTLVIAGSWNHAIINPDWISKFILPNTELKVEIPLNVNGSFRISTDELRIFSIDGKLNFAILKHEESIYKKIGDLGIAIAEHLIHTPVIGFGINYIFECAGNEEIDDLMLVKDSGKISENGFSIVNTTIRRELKIGEKLINLGIVKGKDIYTIDFNYHNKINSLVEFKDKFESDNMIDFKNESIDILKGLYNMEME